MIGKYSKQEIINAINIRSRFDAQLEPALEMIIKRERLNRAYAEWETANKASVDALNAFANYQKQLIHNHNGIKIAELSKEETDEYIRLAKISETADQKEEFAYKKLKKVEVQNESKT